MLSKYLAILQSHVGFGTVCSAFAALIVLYSIQRIVYNLYLHPLSQFPGPLLSRTSRLPMMYKALRGTIAFDVKHLHDQYGPVVRIADNELSFTDARAWKDIYSHGSVNSTSNVEMAKNPDLYLDMLGESHLLYNTAQTHAALRRRLANGFSVQRQAPVVKRYVDLLMTRLREQCAGETAQDMCSNDVTEWYNRTSFDLICDLIFAESFGCLEDIVDHPWAGTLPALSRLISVSRALRSMGLGIIIQPFSQLMKVAFCRIFGADIDWRLKRRMELNAGREDLMEPLFTMHDQKHGMDRLRSSAFLLLIAGSETVAALLSGITYLLLLNPNALKRLKDELDSTFELETDITTKSVERLPYLRACVDEALRFYPPLPDGMSRIVPKGGAWIAGRYVAQDTVVSCCQYAMHHFKDNWSRPSEFLPERFLKGHGFPEDEMEAFQPFSTGPRDCLGRNLAYAEILLVLSRLIFSFDITLADPDSDWLKQKAYAIWQRPELNVLLKLRPSVATGNNAEKEARA